MINFSSEIELTLYGITLRPWCHEDAEKIIQSATNPLIWTFTTGLLTNTSDIYSYVSQAIADRESQTRYSFAILSPEHDTIIGSSSLGNISIKDGRIEIGWTWLALEYHGTGVNTIVKYLLLKYCFEELKVHRVEFKTDNSNPRSCGALEKIGATREGILRSHTLMHDGRYRDTVFYSILNEEWAVVSAHLYNLIVQDI